MKNLKLLCLTTFITLSSSAFGQQFIIAHGGLSLPFSDYGDVNENNDLATGANVGINADIFYTYPLSSFGLGLYVEGGLNFNGQKKDYKQQTEDFFNQFGVNSNNIKHSKYFSIPFSVGANYIHDIDRDLSVYGHVGLAGNILQVTKGKIETDNETITAEYDMCFGNGIKVGLGVIYQDNITLSINMFNLGLHEVQGEIDFGSISVEPDISEVNMSYFALTVGKKF